MKVFDFIQGQRPATKDTFFNERVLRRSAFDVSSYFYRAMIFDRTWSNVCSQRCEISKHTLYYQQICNLCQRSTQRYILWHVNRYDLFAIHHLSHITFLESHQIKKSTRKRNQNITRRHFWNDRACVLISLYGKREAILLFTERGQVTRAFSLSLSFCITCLDILSQRATHAPGDRVFYFVRKKVRGCFRGSDKNEETTVAGISRMWERGEKHSIKSQLWS